MIDSAAHPCHAGVEDLLDAIAGCHVATLDLNPSETGLGPITILVNAAACAFLVSDEAGYITGQILGVNGGRNT